MNKKQLIVGWILVILLLNGCATVNFSSKYYSLPTNYKNDIEEVWQDIVKKVLSTAGLKEAVAITPTWVQVATNAPSVKSVAHKYTCPYSYKITKDNETQIPGIPQIEGYVISLPDYFIRYVYEFYYPNYHKNIIACIILHELAHTEASIDASPPAVHYKCDKYAIDKLLPISSYTVNDFYSSLIAVRDYWSARKGAGGHLFNIGWNALNIYTIALGGSGTVGDLFATDINTRLSLLKKDYPHAKFSYQRTK